MQQLKRLSMVQLELGYLQAYPTCSRAVMLHRQVKPVSIVQASHYMVPLKLAY
jgi:hypothetical protein